MANNIEIIFKQKGIEKIAQDLKSLGNAPGLENTPFGSKGVKGWDPTKMSDAFKRANPELIKLLEKSTQQGMTDGAKKAASAMAGTVKNALQQPAARPDWRNLAAGALTSNSNPFLAARFITSFFRGFGGGGGGAFGEKGLFGGAAGQNLAMAGTYVALRTSAELLRYAFTRLVESVRDAANLYKQAARVGRTPGRESILQAGLESIGVSPQQAMQLQLNTQFSRRGRGRGQGSPTFFGADEILKSAHGVMQAGEIQQIANLSKYLDQFIKESRLFGQVMQDTSKQLFETEFAFSGLKREWKTLWTDLAFEISIILKPAIRGLGAAIHLVNMYVQGSPMFRLAQLLGAKSGPDEFKQAFGGAGGRNIPLSGFQRLGFNMGPVRSDDQVSQLRKANDHLKIIADAVSGKRNGLNKAFSALGIPAWVMPSNNTS